MSAAPRVRPAAVWHAFRAVPDILWRADPRLTAGLFVLQTVQILIPLAQLWIAKLVIDRLVSALRLPHPLDASGDILWLVVIGFGLAAAGIICREWANYARQVLAERLTGYVSTTILAHAQDLDLEMLERPEYHDRLRRAEESAFYRPGALLFQTLAVYQGGVTLLAAIAILARLQPLALPLLLVATIPYALVQAGAAAQLYSLSLGQTAEARQARYFSQLLSTDASAKEIRVFGLGPHLLDRFRAILAASQSRLARVARVRGLRSAATALLPAAAYSAIFAYFSLQALNRAITIGDLTLYIGLVLRSQDALQQTMLNLSGTLENSLFLDDYRAFLQLQPAMRGNHEGAGISLPIRGGVRFEHVSFRYKGASTDALRDVSIELRSGETVAIVGENGAGKTTLVKLLARLYEPRAGRVTVDGRDLADLDADAWRNQIAVIFQDFVQYFLSARDNIGFGQIDALEDQTRIEAAAARGGADSVIARLPGGYDSLLGRWFEQGKQLSGGEWQRIALARAFMRDAPILVLDEPTAALDARAEAEIFSRFRELAAGRIVLLISHRFSTVRAADRILVLDQGQVIEEGSHDELMAREGRYADLFRLQAAGYQ